MSFFKRLSRSRSNSQSYVDNYDSRHDSKTNSASYDDQHHSEPAAGRPSTSLAPSQSRDLAQKGSAGNMYSRPAQQQADLNHGGYTQSRDSMANAYKTGASQGYDGAASTMRGSQHEPAPDLLLQAFNQALRPYNDKVENLENEIHDLKAYIDQLEAQQRDVHTWIDKRGLRPDVPPSIAAQMDSASHASSPTHAAATLNAQLDRKITIVNFDLHRLQDDLNDSLPTPSFSACMLKFLPDIARLTALPSGPRYAFDLLLKLGGNLNSHGGLEAGDEEDRKERRQFYARLDDSMVGVVEGRFAEEAGEWSVGREIKRIEKTGAYLRNWGVEPYFPRTLGAMREGSSAHGVATGNGAPSANAANNSAAPQSGGAAGGATSPPVY